MIDFNLIAAETIAINLMTTPTPPDGFIGLDKLIATIQTPSVIANFLALLVGFQLNFEVAHMIFSKKANYTDVQNAKAKSTTEGKAEGLTAAQSWFKQYQSDPDNAPPPPWSNNGSNNGQSDRTNKDRPMIFSHKANWSDVQTPKPQALLKARPKAKLSLKAASTLGTKQTKTSSTTLLPRPSAATATAPTPLRSRAPLPANPPPFPTS